MTLEELNRTSPFHAGAENTAFAPYFDGTSYLNMLSTEQVPVGCVTFAPGCRNHWHIHRAARGGGQILLVTAGRGWYQEWGEAPRALRPGDVVKYPAQCQALARGGSGQRLFSTWPSRSLGRVPKTSGVSRWTRRPIGLWRH